MKSVKHDFYGMVCKLYICESYKNVWDALGINFITTISKCLQLKKRILLYERPMLRQEIINEFVLNMVRHCKGTFGVKG